VAEQITVEEASAAYAGAMRNVLPAGPGICAVCNTFIASGYTYCYRCNDQPDLLDAIVPITYSEHLGQMHVALRNYKEAIGPPQRYAMVRLGGVLWRFLDEHESCIANAAGVDAFDVVTTVPSSTRARDDARGNLRTMVGWWAKDRFERLLRPTDRVPPGRDFHPNRYESERPPSSVLLVDDTWATGGHAQSAAYALGQAGAETVAFVCIGRHVRPDWEVEDGETCADRMAALPRQFDWGTCAVHID
jgi:predicted amidophosphoribosyltransferase